MNLPPIRIPGSCGAAESAPGYIGFPEAFDHHHDSRYYTKDQAECALRAHFAEIIGTPSPSVCLDCNELAGYAVALANRDNLTLTITGVADPGPGPYLNPFVQSVVITPEGNVEVTWGPTNNNATIALTAIATAIANDVNASELMRISVCDSSQFAIFNGNLEVELKPAAGDAFFLRNITGQTGAGGSNLEDLEINPVTDLNRAVCFRNIGDGMIYFYQLRSSVATPNGTSVIAPLVNGTGVRWILMPVPVTQLAMEAAITDDAQFRDAIAIGDDAVLYDRPQSLTEPQQTQARVNIDLDDGLGNLPTSGIKLADSSAVALPDGVLGFNGSDLTIHDGVTVGGNVYPALLPQGDELHSVGTRVITPAEIAAGEQMIELARFPVSASQAQPGRKFKFTGNIKLIAPEVRPGVMSFGLIPELSEGSGAGIIIGADMSQIGFNNYEMDMATTIEIVDQLDGTFLPQVFQEGGIQKSGHNGNVASVTANGTAYTLTTSMAAVNFGGTDPVVGLAGFLLRDFYVRLGTTMTGATFAQQQTISARLQQLTPSNQPFTGSEAFVMIPPMTAYTGPGPDILIGPFRIQSGGLVQSTVTAFAAISALPSAGSVQISSARIDAFATGGVQTFSMYSSGAELGTIGVDQDFVLQAQTSQLAGGARIDFVWDVRIEFLP